MSIKYNAVAAALASVGAMLTKLNDTYGALNSQDADFKNLKTEVDAALALPDDPSAGELAPQFTVMSLDQVADLLDDLRKSIPSLSAIVAQVADHIEQSDVAVLAALAETRTDVLEAVKPAA
jgi:hypothetical protein